MITTDTLEMMRNASSHERRTIRHAYINLSPPNHAIFLSIRRAALHLPVRPAGWLATYYTIHTTAIILYRYHIKPPSPLLLHTDAQAFGSSLRSFFSVSVCPLAFLLAMFIWRWIGILGLCALRLGLFLCNWVVRSGKGNGLGWNGLA